MVRRADGQVVQLPEVLFAVAENADGRHSLGEIADEVSRRAGKRFREGDIRFLIDERLRPLGLFPDGDGAGPPPRRRSPMLALNLRTAVVPPNSVSAITSLLKPLFWPGVVIAVVLGVAGLDGWLLLQHGVAQGVRQLLYNPLDFLLVVALVVASAAFHECGHATACRYGGARPGALGAGLYLVWPVFYSDVTDAYRLNRAGRLRTDLGGIYFNAIFMLATAAVYALTHFELLAFVVVLQNVEIVRQLLPFLRLDGYYIVADLTGVPDIFSRIKPTLSSLVPGRAPDPRVAELKSWTRAVVTAWVVGTVLVLLYFYATLLVAVPRIVGTSLSSLRLQERYLATAAAGHEPLGVGVGVLEMVLLLLPLAGLALTLVRLAQRVVGWTWLHTRGRPQLRVAAGLVASTALVLLVLAWLPHGRNYEPLQPGEHGTLAQPLTSAVKSVTYWWERPASSPGQAGGVVLIPAISTPPLAVPPIGIGGFRTPAITLPGLSLPALTLGGASTPTSGTPAVKAPTLPGGVTTSLPTALPTALPTTLPTVSTSVTATTLPTPSAGPSGTPSTASPSPAASPSPPATPSPSP